MAQAVRRKCPRRLLRVPAATQIAYSNTRDDTIISDATRLERQVWALGFLISRRSLFVD